MKRTIAAGLSAALLCGMVVPAFAADTKTATNTTGTTQTQPTAPVKLTFDKLEETVRRNNVTIKANNNTVLSAEKDRCRRSVHRKLFPAFRADFVLPEADQGTAENAEGTGNRRGERRSAQDA